VNCKAALLIAGIFAFAAPAMAHDDPSKGLPGSVFQVPDTGAGHEDHDELEIVTDLPMFLARGYAEPDWDAHSDLVGQVARDLAVPDYVKRTGNPAPESASIEIASVQITKKGFNDLLIRSRLPGDCDETGCLTQVYVMKGQQWEKALEFKSYGVALKDGEDPVTTMVAAVGGEYVGSKVIVWNGQEFVQ